MPFEYILYFKVSMERKMNHNHDDNVSYHNTTRTYSFSFFFTFRTIILSRKTDQSVEFLRSIVSSGPSSFTHDDEMEPSVLPISFSFTLI
mmetsp:Transcript_11458/g.27376  ORF Transcript_11458/g.27376 Transcript_11458/m.27376 type:complete len:90 (-) Transcript_11458:3653-3922(-)